MFLIELYMWFLKLRILLFSMTNLKNIVVINLLLVILVVITNGGSMAL